MGNKDALYGYMFGWLGNQLFQYATFREIQLSHLGADGKIIIDQFSKFNRGTEDNKLINYKLCQNVEYVNSFEISPVQKLVKKSVGYRFCKTARQMYNFSKFTSGYAQRFGIIKCEDGYIRISDKLAKPIIADGLFQSGKYFPTIRENLLEEIVPIHPVFEKNIKVIEDIKNSESICMAVRLGDYVNNKTHQVCTPTYYKRALDKMLELHPTGKIFLFSDDPEQAKKLIELPEGTFIEYGNDPDYEALRVMSNCKHFIISNSTFHWWAQYLGTHKNKTVIAPDRWFNVDIPCDIYQDNWLLVNPDEKGEM